MASSLQRPSWPFSSGRPVRPGPGSGKVRAVASIARLPTPLASLPCGAITLRLCSVTMRERLDTSAAKAPMSWKAAGDAQRDRQFGVVVLHHDLARAEQLELQAAAEAGLVDVGQQRIHLGLAGELLLELGHVFLDLALLLAQLGQVHRLGQLALEVLLQRRLAGALAVQRGLHVGQHEEPADEDHPPRRSRRKPPAWAAAATGRVPWG